MFKGEQEPAYIALADFIINGDPRNTYFSLVGKAGTGKTFVLAEIARKFNADLICVSAVAHKAKKVIYERCASPNVQALSVASLLGQRMNIETGEFSDEWGVHEPPIERFHIVFVDECSMIPKEVLDKIMEKKFPNTIVVFAGDKHQIRPIRKKSLPNDLSPTLTSKVGATLTTRVRQGAGHPILEHSDYYAEQTESQRPVLRNLQRDNVTTAVGSISYTDNLKFVLQHVLGRYQSAIDTRNTNIIKTVCYRNKRKDTINQAVRKMLFASEADNDFVIGELMILDDNYRPPVIKEDEFADEDVEQSPYTTIDNSDEFIIDEIVEKSMSFDLPEEVFGYDFDSTIDFCELTSRTDDRYICIPVVAMHHKQLYSDIINTLFKHAHGLPKTQKKERTKAFAKYEEVKNTFARANYGYAISAHKSQGSTYHTVIVDIKDMVAAPVIGQEIASLIYTAMTRASHDCFMVSDQFTRTVFPAPEPEYEV